MATKHYPIVTPRRGDKTIAKALSILGKRLRQPGEALSSPQAVRDYLRLMLADKEHEVFTVIYLDSQNRVIATESPFHGTLTQTAVYPREVVKRALHYNCASAILAHNHPSGCGEPSQADRWLTDQLKSALGMVDVKVLDHFIVANENAISFAEHGWL